MSSLPKMSSLFKVYASNGPPPFVSPHPNRSRQMAAQFEPGLARVFYVGGLHCHQCFLVVGSVGFLYNFARSYNFGLNKYYFIEKLKKRHDRSSHVCLSLTSELT